jgi:hypothetical protein
MVGDRRDRTTVTLDAKEVLMRRISLSVLGLTLLAAGSGVSCGGDEAAGPSAVSSEAVSLHPEGARTIVVRNSAELVAALSPDNAGRRILVRAGTYPIEAPLSVPDGTTLKGEGVMRFDGAGLPVGFAPGTHTTLTMTANTPGNVLTLGDGAVVRGLGIADLPGRLGNLIGVVSREAGDRVAATIVESELINPNPHGIVPEGPIGCGLVALTLNPNMGLDPAPHAGAEIRARMVRSLIRSPAAGIVCGLFAFNFAPLGRVSVTLKEDVVGGGIIANGGVSRPDAVHDALTRIDSHHNLYRDDSPNPCVSQHLGWNVQGGSGSPVPLLLPETARNTLRIHSVGDRIAGFTTGILGTGGRRFFPSPTAGPTTGNRLDLTLLGTTISTPSCGGAPFVADLRLAGALVTNPTLVPGDGNILRAVIRGMTGSGPRSNVYADALGPAGPLAPEFQGSGNRLKIVGTLKDFARTNRRINPRPGVQHFTGGAQ